MRPITLTSFFLICLAAHTSALKDTNSNSAAIPLPIEPGAVNVLLVYSQAVNDYFYVREDAAQATYSAILGFDVLDSTIGDGTVALRYNSNGRYWQIRESDSKLIMATTAANRSPFLLVPISEGDQAFIATVNGTPLVTIQSRPPFEFYLQSRYPTEPPALFSFDWEFDVEGSYANNRSNIVRTADFISASTTTDQVGDYKRLVDLMGSNGHFSGQEVFHVAHKIQSDIGNQSEAFRSLPAQVQFLSADPILNLKLFYTGREGNLSLPMKYVTADEAHSNALPYQFYYMASNQSWAISYADLHKLYIRDTTAYLMERTDGLLEYTFRLSMHAELRSFAIQWSPSAGWYDVERSVATQPFRFWRQNGGRYYDNFYVEPSMSMQ